MNKYEDWKKKRLDLGNAVGNVSIFFWNYVSMEIFEEILRIK